MAKTGHGGEKWGRLVAEAERSGLTHREFAKRHGVAEHALKYHIYKARRAAGKSQTVRILPVESEQFGAVLTVRMGVMVLQFGGQAEPRFVAGVLRALGKSEC